MLGLRVVFKILWGFFPICLILPRVLTCVLTWIRSENITSRVDCVSRGEPNQDAHHRVFDKSV